MHAYLEDHLLLYLVTDINIHRHHMGLIPPKVNNTTNNNKVVMYSARLSS